MKCPRHVPLANEVLSKKNDSRSELLIGKGLLNRTNSENMDECIFWMNSSFLVQRIKQALVTISQNKNKVFEL